MAHPVKGAIRETRATPWTNSLIHAGYLLACLGATEPQMAEIIGVPLSTIKYWKRSRPEFDQAVKDGTVGLASKVSQAFIQRCLGYEYQEEIATYDRQTKTYIKDFKTVHVPPDPWSCARLLELKARDFNWSVTQQVQINNINTNIDINYNELTTEQLLVLKEISQKGLPQNAGDSNS
jgi:hypothetical protein